MSAGLGQGSPSAQATLTKYHRLHSLNSRHLFLLVLEAGKSKIKALPDSVRGKSLLRGLPLRCAVPGLSLGCAPGERARVLTSTHVTAFINSLSLFKITQGYSIVWAYSISYLPVKELLGGFPFSAITHKACCEHSCVSLCGNIRFHFSWIRTWEWHARIDTGLTLRNY